MSTSEGIIKAELKKMLKAYEPEVWYFMPIGGPYAAKGTPDFILCVAGDFISVETKAKGKKPTVLQELCMAKIRVAGGQAYVIDCEEKIWVLEEDIKFALGGVICGYPKEK